MNTISKLSKRGLRDLIDAETADAIARAEYFTCCIYANRRYMRQEAATLAEARAFAPAMEQAANNHRKAMIYAVTPENASIFVPDYFSDETLKVHPSGSVECPHCRLGYHPLVIQQHIREKH